MNRREMIRSAVLGAGAAASAGAQEQHSHIHVKSIAPAQAAAAAEPWTPAVLDAHQNDTVIQLSELIIPTTDTPGAKAAKVNEWVDLHLKALAEDKGHSFLQGLGWLDGYAIRRHQNPFVRCTPAQQVAILESLDDADSAYEEAANLYRRHDRPGSLHFANAIHQRGSQRLTERGVLYVVKYVETASSRAARRL